MNPRKPASTIVAKARASFLFYKKFAKEQLHFAFFRHNVCYKGKQACHC